MSLPLFDGFSIGSNDLTQLTLGLDRDSLISYLFSEQNGGKKFNQETIHAAKRNKIKVDCAVRHPVTFLNSHSF
jgi:pyruvate,water dikinase